MLLTGYSMEINKAAACKPGYQPLYCIAHLNEDIREVLPYLNAEMKGIGFTENPPSMMLQVDDRQIAIQPNQITINDIRDGEEADRILKWLQQKINEIWERRAEITPTTKTASPLKVVDIMRILPKTNCGDCGEPTCTVFASLALQGKRDEQDCPQLDEESRKNLAECLKRR